MLFSLHTQAGESVNSDVLAAFSYIPYSVMKELKGTELCEY